MSMPGEPEVHSPKRLKDAYTYFNTLRVELGIGLNFLLLISDIPVPVSENAHATCTVHDTMNRATIALANSFWELPPEEQRYYAVHELLHILYGDMDDALEAVATTISPEHLAGLKAVHTRAEERIVDLVANIIAKNASLPHWAKAKIKAGKRKKS